MNQPSDLSYLRKQFNPQDGLPSLGTKDKLQMNLVADKFNNDPTNTSPSEIVRNTEVINMNAGFLLSVLATLEEYRNLRLRGIMGSRKSPDYFFQLHNILSVLRDQMESKLTKGEKSEIDPELDRIHTEITKSFQQTSKGIYMIENNMYSIERDLSKMYRRFMQAIDDSGMLTHKAESPNLAMTELSD